MRSLRTAPLSELTPTMFIRPSRLARFPEDTPQRQTDRTALTPGSAGGPVLPVGIIPRIPAPLSLIALFLTLPALLSGCGNSSSSGSPDSLDTGAAAGSSDHSSNPHEAYQGEQSVSAFTHRYAGNGPLTAVCTTGMVADVVRHVGGEHVTVVQLMGAGVDPHLFQANPRHVSQMARADMIFYSGLHLEGKLEDLFHQMAESKPALAITQTIPPDRLIRAAATYYDPHVWNDVALWSETVNAVAEALARFDPAHAEAFRENAAAYRTELLELDEYSREQLATIPEDRRVLVTAHDAFQYFARAYDLEVKAIQGVTTQSEVSTRKINELVDFLVARKIRSVFVESSVPERAMSSLIEGCAAQGHTVSLGGELFSDAMGEEGTLEGTYIGMIRYNVEQVRDALQ